MPTGSTPRRFSLVAWKGVLVAQAHTTSGGLAGRRGARTHEICTVCTDRDAIDASIASRDLTRASRMAGVKALVYRGPAEPVRRLVAEDLDGAVRVEPGLREPGFAEVPCGNRKLSSAEIAYLEESEGRLG